MNQAERNKKIELYGKGFDLLLETLQDIPREMWKFKPQPKEWSVYEVLIHLADSESNAALRARPRVPRLERLDRGDGEVDRRDSHPLRPA